MTRAVVLILALCVAAVLVGAFRTSSPMVAL